MITAPDRPAPGYPLKNDYADGTGLCQIRARWLNAVADFLLGLDIRYQDDISEPYIDRTSPNPADWVIYIPTTGAGGLDLSTAAFGYKIDPNGDNPDLVRIYAGEIDRIPVAQTDLTVADGNYVYVRRTIANDTMAIYAGASVPADSATYRYYKLYEFTVTGGAASIKKIWRPFSIETLPSPPDTENDYVLMSIAGVVQWVQTEEFACPV